LDRSPSTLRGSRYYIGHGALSRRPRLTLLHRSRSAVRRPLFTRLGNAEALVHDRARRRVLQRHLLGGIEVGRDGERGQGRFVEAGKDELLFSRIRIDIPDGEHTRDVGLKLLRVDDNRAFLDLETPFGDRPELGVQPEEHERVIRLQVDELPLGRLDANARKRAILLDHGMRDRFDVAHAAARDQVLHLRDGGRRSAELGPAMHERETSSLACELERPIERGIAAAENHESLSREVRGALDLAVNVAAFELLGAFASEPARLEAAETARDDDCFRVTTRIERGAHQKRAVIEALELGGLLAQAKRRVERFDLLEESVDQLLRTANGQRGNVVNRLVRIQLAALPARVLQRIDDVRVDAEQTELENLEQAAGSRPDNDDIRLNRAFDQRLRWG